MSVTLKIAKASRIEIRLTAEEKKLLSSAARSLGQDLSSFILGLTLPKAKEVVKEEMEWMHSKKNVEAFLSIVSEEKDIPALKELFNRYNNNLTKLDGSTHDSAFSDNTNRSV